jgi:serine/threonine-protein kinase RsbT
MEEMGYPLIDQSMTVAAVSELARNIVIHAGRGTMSASCEERGTKRGITCVFEDAGPGIDDLEKILQKKSGAGMSVELGLSGSRNLSDEFSVKSSIGKGTTVSITKWLRIVPLH